MSTTERGRVAEKLAANYLEQRGYQVVERNWRNRFAEIDIIARHQGVMHFVEVKYRASSDWGGGLETITYDKAQRMRRAVYQWSHDQSYGGPMQLDVISVSGLLTRPVIEYVPNALGDS